MKPLLVALLAVLCGAGRPACAQGQGQAEPLEPGLALLAATLAYAEQPFAERLRVYVGPRPWEGRSETAVVRCDPLGRRVRLELGALEVYLAEGRMVAIRRDNPGDVLVREYAPPLTMATLGELLPPVPSPGLALALDEDLDALAPYLPIEAWRRAGIDAATGAATLEGQLAGAGQISVHLERSDRVGDVVARLDDDRWLSIQVTAAPAGDPAEWAIEPSGRRRVSSLADLAPTRPLRAGDAAHDLLFIDAEGRPWRLSEALGSGPLAVVLVRPRRDGAIEAARAGLDALDGRTGLSPVVAVVYAMEAWSLEAVRRDEQAILDGPGAAGEGAPGTEPQAPAPPPVLWSVSPAQVADLAPGAPAALVLVRADGALAGVIPLPGSGVEAVTADLDAALEGL